MGTLLRIQVRGAASQETLDEVKCRMAQAIQRLEELLSLYRDHSEISHINSAAGDHPVCVSPETRQVVEVALRFAHLTDRACDPTIYPLVRLWEVYRSEGRIPDDRARDLALERVGFERVEVDAVRGTIFLKEKGMGLDLGWIGKGFALDRALEVAQAQPDIVNVMLDFGGQLLFWDRYKPHPQCIVMDVPGFSPHQLPQFLLRDNASVSTTSCSERGCHVLDPRVGTPPSAALSVSVVAPTATTADALSTALFVLGPDDGAACLKRISGVRAYVIPRTSSARANPLVFTH